MYNKYKKYNDDAAITAIRAIRIQPSRCPVMIDTAPAVRKTIVSMPSVISSFDAVGGVAFCGIALHNFTYMGAPTKKVNAF